MHTAARCFAVLAIIATGAWFFWTESAEGPQSGLTDAPHPSEPVPAGALVPVEPVRSIEARPFTVVGRMRISACTPMGVPLADVRVSVFAAEALIGGALTDAAGMATVTLTRPAGELVAVVGQLNNHSEARTECQWRDEIELPLILKPQSSGFSLRLSLTTAESVLPATGRFLVMLQEEGRPKGWGVPVAIFREPIVAGVVLLTGIAPQRVDVLVDVEGRAPTWARSIDLAGSTPEAPVERSVALLRGGAVYGSLAFTGGPVPETPVVLAIYSHNTSIFPNVTDEHLSNSVFLEEKLRSRRITILNPARDPTFRFDGLIAATYRLNLIGSDNLPRGHSLTGVIENGVTLGPVVVECLIGQPATMAVRFAGRSIRCNGELAGGPMKHNYIGRPADEAIARFDAVPDGDYHTRPKFYCGDTDFAGTCLPATLAVPICELLARVWEVQGIWCKRTLNAPETRSLSMTLDDQVREYESWSATHEATCGPVIDAKLSEGDSLCFNRLGALTEGGNNMALCAVRITLGNLRDAVKVLAAGPKAAEVSCELLDASSALDLRRIVALCTLPGLDAK